MKRIKGVTPPSIPMTLNGKSQLVILFLVSSAVQNAAGDVWSKEKLAAGRDLCIGPQTPLLKWKKTGIEVERLVTDANGVAYIAGHGSNSSCSVSALTADGALKWRSDCAIGDCTGIAVGTRGIVYVVGKEGLAALGPTGEGLWKRRMTPRGDSDLLIGSPVVVPDALYVAVGAGSHEHGVFEARQSSQGTLYAFTPDGDVNWKYAICPPPLCDNPAPVVGNDGTVYVPCMDGGKVPTIHTLTPGGELKWRYEVADSSLLDWLVERTFDEMRRAAEGIPNAPTGLTNDSSLVRQRYFRRKSAFFAEKHIWPSPF